MGRKKRHHQFKSKTRIIETVPIKPSKSERLTNFYDLVEMAGFSLPWQLKEWRRFFLSEESYLDEAEQWLSLRLQGVLFPRVTDDVDRKRMSPQGYATREYDGSEWANWPEWGNCGTGTDHFHYQPISLPLTPLLPAPSGRSATPQHCM